MLGRKVPPVRVSVTASPSLLLVALALGGCSEAPRAERPRRTRPAGATQSALARVADAGADAGTPAAPPVAAVADPVAHEVTEARREDGEPYLLHRFRVALARVRIDVVDMQMQTELDQVLAARGASLVVNGGYYGTDARPEGLVVAGGRLLNPLLPRIGGGVVVIRGGRAEHDAADGFVLPAGADFAIQCSPQLVVGGAPAITRVGTQTASRTALCLRGRGRVLDVIVADARGPYDRGRAGPTLHALAQQLAAGGCEEALNLDGGPSTGFAWRGAEGALTRLPRRGVRHAIVFTPRP